MRTANGFSSARLSRAALLGTSAVFLVTAGASAQNIATSPPPVRSSVDSNGVDLVSGALIVSTPQLSIGQGEGALAYTRDLTGSGWVDNTIGTINVNGSAITVSFGGASDSFTLSGGVYSNAVGGGSTLTYSATNQQYTYTTAAGVVVVFNATLPAYSPSYANGGRPITATYPDGLVVTYTYQTVTVLGTSAARLQSVNNNLGYQLKFTYANNSPATVSDLVAWTTISTVSGVNNAIEYCSPSANSCTFSHAWPTVTYAANAGPPSTVTVTDPIGNQSIFTYNSSGQLAGIQRPGTTINNIGVYYSSGKVYSVSNSAKVVGPKGAGPGYWYYGFSTVSGVETTTVLDPLNNTRTVVSSTTTGLVTSDTDALNRKTSYLYDSYGRLTQTTFPEGNYVVYTYDARGNIKTTTTHPSSGSGTIVTQASFDTTCTQLSKCNKPNTSTDADNNITTYAYSPTTGQLTSVTGPPPITGAVAPKTQFTYSNLYPWYIQSSGGGVTQGPIAVSTLTSASTCQTTASCSGTSDQVLTTLVYGTTGVANNLGATSVTTASGAGTPSETSSQTYDNYGNVVTTTGPLGSAQTSVYFYDLNRDFLGVIGPLATGQTTYPALVYVWSQNGQVTEIAHGTATSQASLAGVTVFEQQNILYDAIGRKVQSGLVSGGTTQTLTQWTYDNANNLVCTAVRMNPSTFASEPASACVAGTPGSYGPDRIAFNAYDAAYELTSITLGYLSPQQTTYEAFTYTGNGFVSTVADANNNLTTYQYDGYDRPLEIEYPSPTTHGVSNAGDYEGYTWDPASNLLTDRRRSGDTITFGYDALNREMSASYSANSAWNTQETFDLLSRPLSVSYVATGLGNLYYTWDALSRITTETLTGNGEPTGGRQVSYGYDAAGNVTSITWPDAGANALSASYSYDVLLRVTQISSGSNVVATYAYDQYGRRSTITRNGGAGAGTTYGYDGADRINSLAQSLAGSGAVTWTMSYDPANSLVSRQASSSSYLWHPGSASSAYTTNGLNQYTAVGSSSMGYDLRANLNSDGTIGNSLTFDSNNNLLTASSPTPVTLTYDPLGRLQTKTSGGSTETFLYADQMLIGEYSSAGTILGRYVPGPDQDEAVLWYQGSGTSSPSWLHADQQGSTIAWSNGTGTSQGSQAYDPFGQPQSWSAGPRFAYTGQLALSEADVYHYKARVYNPSLGRFLQTDTTGYSSDIDVYSYAANDPTDATDPSGATVYLNYGGDTVSCDDSLSDFNYGFDSSGFPLFGAGACDGAGYGESLGLAESNGFSGGNGAIGGGKGGKGGGQNSAGTTVAEVVVNPACRNAYVPAGTLTNAIGFAWASASYLAGLARGTKPQIVITANAIRVTNSPINFANRAVSLGNYQVFTPKQTPAGRGGYTLPQTNNGLHEDGHVYQAAILGDGYIPTEILNAITRGNNNPLETGADNYARYREKNGCNY